MKRTAISLIFLWIVLVLALSASVRAQGGVCKIPAALPESDWVQHARCLLRQVEVDRKLGPALQTLPSPLEPLIGTADVVDKDKLAKYIASRGLEAPEIGAIATPITRVRYFVIHDTSYPHVAEPTFPPSIDDPARNARLLRALSDGTQTHLWVDRVGNSIVSKDYGGLTKMSAVKLEVRYPRLKGLLVHTELIQPRQCKPGVRCCNRNAKGEIVCNDPIGPSPGFTNPQLDRLALLYVIASSRRGRWLIPAFHGVVDDEFGTRAHDDPQNFDLDNWAQRIQLLIDEINK